MKTQDRPGIWRKKSIIVQLAKYARRATLLPATAQKRCELHKFFCKLNKCKLLSEQLFRARKRENAEKSNGKTYNHSCKIESKQGNGKYSKFASVHRPSYSYERVKAECPHFPNFWKRLAGISLSGHRKRTWELVL